MQKIEYIDINKLKPNENNPRTIGDKEFKKLCQSIKNNKEYFETRPILVNKEMIIFAGNMRYRAAKEIGLKEVPASIMDVTKEKEEELMIRDNIENGEWNYDDLAGFDIQKLEDYGFDKSELEKQLDILKDVEEDDFDAEAEAEKIKEPVSKLGDMYQLGEHRLLCGDCTKEEDVKKLMGGVRARLIFTNPPYNVNYLPQDRMKGIDKKKQVRGYGDAGIFNDNKSDEDCLDFYTKVLRNLYIYSADDVSIYWWFGMKNYIINQNAFDQSDWYVSQTLIWLKNSMLFSRGVDYHRLYEPVMFGWKNKKTHYRNKKIHNYKDVFNLDLEDFSQILDVWYENRDNVMKYVHPTQKPVRLAERALKKNSAVGDVVLDVFGGSGSTLLACDQLQRKCYMMELDPKYADVIIKRWEQFTGNQAVKI